MTEQIIQEMQIGYLFKDEENNIISIPHSNLINPKTKTNDEFEINNEFLVERLKITDDKIEKLDTTKLSLSNLRPLFIEPFYLELIGFFEDQLNNKTILKKKGFYFNKSELGLGVKLAYTFDTDAVYPVIDMCSIQLALTMI